MAFFSNWAQMLSNASVTPSYLTFCRKYDSNNFGLIPIHLEPYPTFRKWEVTLWFKFLVKEFFSNRIWDNGSQQGKKFHYGKSSYQLHQLFLQLISHYSFSNNCVCVGTYLYLNTWVIFYFSLSPMRFIEDLLGKSSKDLRRKDSN